MFARGKNDVWWCYIPVQDGRPVQRSTGTSNRKLAARMERMVHDLRDLRRWDVLTLLADGRITVGAAYDAHIMKALDALVGREASPTVGSLLDGWLASLDMRAETKDTYRRQVTETIGEDTRVAALTPGFVRDALALPTLTSGTRRTYFAAVSSFCHYCVAHLLLASHPLSEKGQVPRPKRNAPRMTWMTGDEDEALCLAAASPYREYFALVHGTGAERNAALAMTKADIDTRHWTAHIPGTKTATRDRDGVPVDPWAQRILAPFLTRAPAGPLFPELTAGRVNVTHRKTRTAKALTDRNAAFATYQLRDARHSVAIRWLVLDGVPIYDVAERLGHGDATEALKTYTKTALRAAARRLGVTLGARTTSSATSNGEAE